MNSQKRLLLQNTPEQSFPIYATARIHCDSLDIPLFARCYSINHSHLLVCTRLPAVSGSEVSVDISEGRTEFFDIKAKIVEVFKEQEIYFVTLQKLQVEPVLPSPLVR